jgi:hypothetical protein
VPHLRDGFIVAKVGIRAKARTFSSRIGSSKTLSSQLPVSQLHAPNAGNPNNPK